MIPTYFIPFIPVLIQPRAITGKECNATESYMIYKFLKGVSIADQEKYYYLFNDLKLDNIGIYKNRYVKIDLDFRYHIYNKYIAVRRYLENR